MIGMIVDDESRDAITEMINIGVGKAAGLLNEITGSNIQLRVPEIHLIPFRELADVNKNILGTDILSTVMQEFQGNFSGVTALVFPPDSALSLIKLLSGDEGAGADLDAVQVETLKEVGNIIINAVMGSISNVLSEHLVFSLPVYYEGKLSAIAADRLRGEGDDWVVIARTQFLIESMQIEGTILLVLEVGSLERLVESIRKTNG
ncbi:MAG: chemotaxis protein CheX [Methanoregulaceae archaeon]